MIIPRYLKGLKATREAAGLTLAELAQLVAVPVTTLWHWEQMNRAVHPALINVLAEKLNVPPEVLIAEPSSRSLTTPASVAVPTVPMYSAKPHASQTQPTHKFATGRKGQSVYAPQLRRLRMQAGLTSRELATALDMDDMTVISKWERQKTRVRLTMLQRIAQLLGVQVTDLTASHPTNATARYTRYSPATTTTSQTTSNTYSASTYCQCETIKKQLVHVERVIREIDQFARNTLPLLEHRLADLEQYVQTQPK